ncbi:isopeptide-forming domain-containing fimbrial protein [Aeromicrobium sp. P5_D10]
MLLAATMATSGLAIMAVNAPAEAAPVSISLDKTSPATVLVGEPITFSVKASNPTDDGDADFQYNLTFRDVLPAGVAYVSTSAPQGAGDPQQIAEVNGSNQPTGRTILIWSNVADLPDGSDVTLTYKVQPDATTYPVGSTVTNEATGFASSNERKLAKFNGKGELQPDAAISSAQDTATTAISALELHKSEPSSEHELTRGLHDRPTVYSLEVVNNGKAATNGVTVVDYLPAGLEFLGCGAVDNSSPGTEEYPGSGRLTGTPAVSGCLAPTSVTTVNSGLPTGYPAGVYTRVEWTLPSALAANGTYTIKYAAGIALRQNVMPAAGFTSTANLDNNTGASTRESATEIGYTNRAVATGRYQGLNNAGQSNVQVSANDTVTVTAEDIAVAKSVTNSADFNQGGEAEYELVVRTSEYTDGSDIVLVDTLPDGLCPADAPSGTYTTAALAQAAGDCAPTGSNAAIEKVDYVGGAFVITFKSFDLSAEDASKTLRYKARMRTVYSSGDETSAGDSFVNKVALTGTTTPISGTGESGTRAVKDDSEATLGSKAPTLDKRVLPNTAATHTCNESDWDNWEDHQTAAADAGFTTGSRVCFQVRVTFPAGSSTRLPVVTDYLPDNLTYEPNSFALVSGVNTAAYTVDQSALNTAFATGTAALRPGVDVGANRYVEKGKVFAFRVSATVNGNDKTTNDVQGNLAKLRWTNKGGQVSSLRDKADFKVPPIPPVNILKQVAKSPYSSYSGTQTVRQGDVVRFRMVVLNEAPSSGLAVKGLQVWDVLPPLFRCVDVVNLNGGTCTDPGATGHPSFDGSGVYSAIRWTLPATLAPANATNISYDVKVPVGTSVDTEYVNTAAVRTYTTETNLGVAVPHFPANNIDGTVTDEQEDVPAAIATASVKLPAVGMTKTNVTGITETNNSATQAVPGETVTYMIRATIPAHTTVYNGILTDPLPAGIQLISSIGTYSATGADPATAPLPAGVAVSAEGVLTLPPTWTNDTDDPQVFQIKLGTRVWPNHTGTSTLTNTATFHSNTTPGGVLPVTPVRASSDVNPVQPSPTLTKALTTPPTQSTTPAIGESREFVLTASNAPGRPNLYDTVVVDCVPTGLVVTALGSDATQAPAEAGDACASVTGTGTTITWPVGTVAAGSPKTLKYTVKVGTGAAGGQAYKNVAKLTGSTLDNGGNTTTNERVLTATDNKTLTVPPATITKVITDGTLIVGERAKYVLTATLPANVNFYDASITDALPAGLDDVTLSSVTCVNADTTDCTLPTGATLTPSGQNVGWFLGDIAESTQSRTVTLVFTAKVTAATSSNSIGTVRSNTAKVAWNKTNKTDPTSISATFDASATSSAVTYTIQEPKTAITKSVSDTTPAPGDTFTYTVRASNPGGTNVSDAHNVVVKDVVPTGVIVDEATISGGGTYDSDTRTITWNVSVLTVASPNFKEFTYEAELAATSTLDASGRTNTATITRFTSLPVIADGRTYTGSNATATVTPDFPHTTVAKRVVGSAVSYVGQPQNFEIVVTSDGKSPAYKVDVTDVLPKNWSYDAGTATVKVGDAAAIALAPTSDAGNPETITWSDLAPAPTGLPVGKTIVINYTATPTEDAVVDAGAGADVDHTNTVSINAEDKTGATGITGAPFYGGPGDASAQIHSADLEITKTGDGTPVAGKTYSWDIVVKNLGGDTSKADIVVTDTIPEDVSNFSLDGGDDWVCASDEDEWTCTLDADIANGASAPTIVASGLIDSDLADEAEIVNTARVKGHTYDPDLDNNRDTETVEVTTRADLTIDKRLGGTVVKAGENATWTIDVTNQGPSTSRGAIKVVDTLPSGSTFVSATGTGWSCSEDEGVVTCNRADDLAADDAANQITIVAKIPASQTANVVNSAKVSGPTTDPVASNNSDEVSTAPTRTAELTIEKAYTGEEPAVAGDEFSYDMTVHNEGPSTATGVTVVDTLPSYMKFVPGGTGNADWACTAAGQLVTCDFDGSIGVGDDQNFKIKVKIASGHTGTVENTAKVTATEDPTGATDIDVNTPDLESDLEVEKSHDDDNAIAGESLTYDVLVTNHGPSDTDGPIVVEDTVPVGMTYKSASGTGWTCDEDEGVVTCTHADGLVDDANSTFSLTFDIADDAGPATVTNTVTVDGPNTDPKLPNNSDSDPTVIKDQANIKVAKAASADTVDAGDNVSWTIDVTNDGPSTADVISVVDTLPAGLSVVSISGSGWTCSDSTISCTRATLAPGAAPTITVVTKVGSGVAAGTELTNGVEVSTSTPGDDPDDNDSDDSVEVTTAADMTLAKTHTGTPVAGEPFTFTLTATNDGPSDALAPVTISDTLPVGMTYVSANDAWSCVADAVSAAGQEVLCTLVSTDPLLPGTSAPALAMVVDVAADQSGETLVNQAVVDSDTPDPDTTNNEDDDTVTPTDEVDLSITKSHAGPVEVGTQLKFEVNVKNAGPSEARDVKIDDTLPTGLTFVSAEGDGWTCSDDAATCELDEPLAPGASADPITVTVDVTPQAYPTVDNIVEVATSSNDTDDSNDKATDSVVVPPKVDLSVVKELAGKLRVGQQGVYTLTVHNDGTTPDPGPISVTDELPAGLKFVSGTADNWACAANGQKVTCDRDGALAVDATDVIKLTVDVGAKAYPSVTNTAVVSTPSNDIDPVNDKSTIESPVDGSAMLTIDKSLDKQKGDEAVWSIVVTNEGPTETTKAIRVTDKLPKGLKFVSAQGEGWDCSAAGRTVTCDYDGALAVDQSAEIQITTKITVDDGSEIVNVATVEGGNKAAESGVLSDDATAVAPEAEGLIPDTGGPALWLLLAGLLGVFGGGVLVTRRRPKAPQSAGRHR